MTFKIQATQDTAFMQSGFSPIPVKKGEVYGVTRVLDRGFTDENTWVKVRLISEKEGERDWDWCINDWKIIPSI